MEPRNHTPFPSLAFEGETPDGERFHVLVLRQTLTFASGTLEYADTQEPLNTEDTYFGEIGKSGVRQESDLCHYKPRCDLIVNATAHAPGERPVERLRVGLRLQRPDKPAPAPVLSHPLSPGMPLTDRQRAYDAEVLKNASKQPMQGDALIERTLVVTGERRWRKRSLFTRVLWPLAGAWKLTAPQKFTTLALQPDHAFGGEWRINAFDNRHLPEELAELRQGPRLAQRVPAASRLGEDARASHPDAGAPPELQPVAHAAWPLNPVGTGWIPAWCAHATGIDDIAAPRIEHADAPIRVQDLRTAMQNTVRAADLPGLAPATFGVRPKTHPARAALVGTVDAAFLASEATVPADFDFAVWNAAAPEQQCDWLQGDEVLVLSNLCAAQSPGASRDSEGNTVLRLELPRHDCFALIRMHSGEMFEQPLWIDTMIVEPERQTLSLVWRTTIPIDPHDAVRVSELRLRTFEERDGLRELVAALQPDPAEAGAP